MAGNQSQESFEFIHYVSVCEYKYTPNYCTDFCYRKLVESSIPSDATADGISPTTTLTISVTSDSSSTLSTTFALSTRTLSGQTTAASTTTTALSLSSTAIELTTATSSTDAAVNTSSEAVEITSDTSLSSESRVGIGVGVAVGLLVIIIATFFLMRRRRSTKREINQVVQNEPQVGELDGNTGTIDKSAPNISAAGNKAELGAVQAAVLPIFELPAYSQPVEMASYHDGILDPYRGMAALTTSSAKVTNERDLHEQYVEQSMAAQPHITNARDSIVSSVSTSNNISEMEGISRGSSMVVSPRHSDDVEALMQRHSQLEARRQRMVELQKVEEEQAEIEEKLKNIAPGRVPT